VIANDIKKVDPSNDLELTSYITQCGTIDLKFPLVYMRKNKIGGYKDLVSLHASGSIKHLLELSKTEEDKRDTLEEDDDDDKALQLGMLSRTLEGVETVVSYLNPLSWLWRSSKGQSPGQASLNMSNDFDVIHTNWYSRRLRRKMRFLELVFVRIHPKHGDVRAAHKYSEIDYLTMADPTTLVFNYHTGASPDWIQYTAHALPLVLTILRQKLPHLRILNNLQT